MALYPTKEQILANPYEHMQETIDQVQEWKYEYYDKQWKSMNKEDKLTTLGILIDFLNHAEYITDNMSLANKSLDFKEYSYNQEKKCINIGTNNPSILSTLHEYGHHIMGSSELEACRWSVWLFKDCFPNAYKNLKWKGHMLIKENANTN